MFAHLVTRKVSSNRVKMDGHFISIYIVISLFWFQRIVHALEFNMVQS